MTVDLLPGAPSAASPPDPARSGPVRVTVGPARGRRLERFLRPAVIAVVHLLGLGAVLLGARVAYQGASIRLDEAQSLWQTDHSYAAMLRLVAQDVHPPLYHLVLRTWRLVLGSDIQTARTLSLLFLLASVPVFYLVARRCLNTGWALFAVVVYSCSPFLQWYGNEARMYSMLVLITLVSQYFFLGVLTRGSTRSWIGWAASAVVGSYVHYFFFFVLAAQGLFLLVQGRRLPRAAYLRLAAVSLLVAAAFTPWLVYFRANGSAAGTRPTLPSPSSVDYSNVYTQFLFGFQSDTINTFIAATWPLLVLAALASVRLGARLGPATGYLLVAGFVPVLAAFVASHLVTPFFLSRYMIAALPAVLLLAVRFVSTLTRPLARALAVGLLALTVLGTVVQAANPDTPAKEDYRAAAEIIDRQARPQDLVVLSSPFTVYPFEYYYEGSARVTTLPVWDRHGPLPAYRPAELPDDVRSFTQGHQYLYLLLSYDQGYEKDVFQYFETHFQKTASYTPSPGMRLLVYRVGYSQARPVGDR